LAFLYPTPVRAKSYSITQVDIQATINSDGSMTVEEKRLFSFGASGVGSSGGFSGGGSGGAG